MLSEVYTIRSVYTHGIYYSTSNNIIEPKMLFGRFSNSSVKVVRENIAAAQTLEQPVARKESKIRKTTDFGKLVLVVNANSILQEVEQVIRASDKPRKPLLVIYTSKPTLLVEGKSEGEVDYEFAFRLDHGKRFLQNVSQSAERLGVSDVETSFVWENTVADLVDKVN